MHTAGKVFTAFNALLTIGFLLLTAPVVKFRIDTRKAVDEEAAKQPPIEKSVTELRQEVVLLTDQLDLAKWDTTHAVTKGLNNKSQLEAQIAMQEDDLNDVRTRQQSVDGSLREVRGDIAARIEEKTALDAELVDLRGKKDTLDAETTTLKEEVAKAKDDLQKTRASIIANYQKILEAEARVPGQATAKVAQAE